MTASDKLRFQDATQAYESEHYSEAQQELRRLAKIYPLNADIQAAEGMLLVESGKIEAGIPFLAQSYRINPRNDTVAANLGLAYLKIGRPLEAIVPLQAACRLSPRSFIDRVALAEAFYSSQHYAKAAATYADAANLSHTEEDMSETEFHSQWAIALISSGKSLEAISVLHSDSALEHNAALQLLLADAEEKSRNYEEAFKAYKKAAEIEPSETNIDAYGQELLRHWAFPAATEIYGYGVTRYPASERMKVGLGTAYFGKNDFADAAVIFEDLLQMHPDNAVYADILGRSCSAEMAGEIASCVGLREFATRHPANASAALYAGITLMRRPKADGRDDDAETLFQSAIKADPNLAEAWYQIGSLQQSRDDWKGSVVSLERAIALRPSYAEAHYRLARAYARIGRREDSQKEISLQQKYAQEAKDADARRMKDVITFITKNQ